MGRQLVTLSFRKGKAIAELTVEAGLWDVENPTSGNTTHVLDPLDRGWALRKACTYTQDHKPSVWGGEGCPCIRPHGPCDRRFIMQEKAEAILNPQEVYTRWPSDIRSFKCRTAVLNGRQTCIERGSYIYQIIVTVYVQCIYVMYISRTRSLWEPGISGLRSRNRAYSIRPNPKWTSTGLKSE
jgi:hypothetical protein